MNRVILIGNLGKDPELAFTKSQQPVLKFSLATNESWTNKAGEKQERTDWHRIIVWGKRAEGLSKILHKGSQIAIEGSIQYSSYEDKDGNKRYSTDIRADEIHLIGKKENGPATFNSGVAVNDDDTRGLPF